MDLLRTMLFIPGNDPGKLLNAGIYNADSVVIDLEDAVAVSEKDAARDLAGNALKYLEYPCPVGVRINHIGTPFGWDDLKEMIKVRPAFFRLPKSEAIEDIIKVDEFLTKAETQYGYEAGSIKLVLTVETAKGIFNSYQLATASKRIIAMGIGAEDLAADLKAARTKSGKEILFARSHLLLAARAAKIKALDNVFGNVADDEGFYADTLFGKELGFDGKSVIHPKHVVMVHSIYTPTDAELAQAQKIITAYREALANKTGVISLDGKMIDTPVVARAERIINWGKTAGKVKEGGQE